MERDLELVRKYYPIVSNYSYPRIAEATPRNERASVGSDCSVPGMVDDHESEYSTEEDEFPYHSIGDGIWDSFWKANSDSAEANSRLGVVYNKDSYPALVASPVARGRRNGFIGERVQVAEQQPLERSQEAEPRHEITSTWPLPSLTQVPATTQPCAPPRPRASKGTYTLFPQPAPTPRLPVTLTPQRPVAVPPRNSSMSKVSRHNHSTLSLPSLGHSGKPKKLHLAGSDGAIKYTTTIQSTPVIQSAPVTPLLPFFPSTPAKVDASAEFNEQTIRLLRPQPYLPRTSSKTTIVRPQISVSTIDTPATTTYNPSAIYAPPRSPERHRPSIQRSQTMVNMPTIQAQAPTPPVDDVPQTPFTPMSTCFFEQPSLSVFEYDSDSEEDAHNTSKHNHTHSSDSLAWRIVRNLVTSPHKRARSASAAPRTRKGSDIAKEQLRRARTGSTSAGGLPGEGLVGVMDGAFERLAVGEKELLQQQQQYQERQQQQYVPGYGLVAVNADDDARSPALRKQKSEVFGKIMWGRKK